MLAAVPWRRRYVERGGISDAPESRRSGGHGQVGAAFGTCDQRFNDIGA